MGLYTDFIAHSTVIDKTEPQQGTPRSAYNELLQHKAKLDQTRPTAFDAYDEVQVLNAFTSTVGSGNYTITIVDELGVSHTTANLAYDADAATIEAAIDVIMTSDAYADWTNADISVAVTGDLATNDATLTFDGASVTEKNFSQTTVADGNLAGAGTVNGMVSTVNGITTNEVQTINTFLPTVSGGNFTLNVVDELGVNHTTANILYDDNAATIEAAIDTIMTSDGYVGWTNADISVTLGSDLTAGDATLTFDGASVTGKNMGQATIADVDLVGSGTVNGSTTGTPGATVNEVQTLTQFLPTVSGGNFTVTIIDELSTSRTTGNIAYDSAAAVIEAAIDVIMTAGTYSGWTNGDITVTLGSDLTAGDATLTYDGASVTGKNFDQATITNVDLTGSGTVNGSSTGTPGSETAEVQTINTFTAPVTGGNFTLNIVDDLGANYTTASILWNSNAATVEGAINTVMTGNYTSWVNGDITVACTDNLTANDMTLTYDGDSVDGLNMGEVVATDVDLAGGGTVNGSATGTPGAKISEVQTINTFVATVSGGNFTINIVDELAGDHVTANIAYDANAATIETAIDVAMAAYTGWAAWTNGDITVALGTDLTAGDATLTFDGDSVNGLNMGQATVADVDLVAGTVNGSGTTTPGSVTSEVQTINTFVATVIGGSYTINIVDELAVNHVTTNLAYDADAATIEAAIDVAMAAYGSWTNGDITVALGTDLTAGDATLTFDGASVTGKNVGQATIADVDLESGTSNGSATSTPGITTNEVQTINTFIATVTGGNYTLNISDVGSGNTYTTANIAYDANAATIQAAIDTVMTGNHAGWTNADITVALTGDLTANDATLTFDGDSVTGLNMGDLAIADVDLTAPGTVNGGSITTAGQAIRYAWAVMWAYGMISASSLPDQGDLLSPAALDVTPASTTARWPNAALRRALAWQAAIDDDLPALRTQLESLFYIK